MITVDGQPYREFRCMKCRNLLGLEYIFAGRLQIKCRKCNEMNTIDFKTTKAELVKLLEKNNAKEVNK